MQLQVDTAQRFAKMRAHTATHLLHAEIAKIFPNTQQAWSHVDEDQLRFDFQAERLLNNQELKNITENINQIIYEAQEVKIEELSKDEAQKKWAKAFFEDKYGDIVRVVSIYNAKTNQVQSMEFCWWTHVSNTSQIGAFTIVGQEAVASGIKRIIAITWPKVSHELEYITTEYNQQAQKLGVSRKQFPDKLDKILQAFEELQQNLQSLTLKTANQYLQTAYTQAKSNKYFDKIIILEDETITLKLKELIPIIKSFGDETSCIVKSDGSYLILSATWEAKQIAQQLKLRGWWTENIWQWKDPEILNVTKI